MNHSARYVEIERDDETIEALSALAAFVGPTALALTLTLLAETRDARIDAQAMEHVGMWSWQLVCKRASRHLDLKLSEQRRGLRELGRSPDETSETSVGINHPGIHVPLYPVSRVMREAEERNGGRVTAKGSGLEPIDQQWLREAEKELNDRQLAIAKAFADHVAASDDGRMNPYAIEWRGKWDRWVDDGQLAVVEANLGNRIAAIETMRSKMKLARGAE